tara:strand:+ start:1268 stop:1945 length:678 start_codon:yes stop_codon:yes gene_type:complete
MNEKSEDKNQDIKPVRPEVSSSREKRRTKGGSFLFSSMITILNLIGLIVLFLWFFNTSGNQQQAGQNFIERISVLEEGYTAQEVLIQDLAKDVEADLKFVNKEVRKLWDLSNKRNRKNISENLNSIEKLNDLVEEVEKQSETLAAKQRALNLELAKIKKIQEKTKATIEGLNTQTDSGLDSNSIQDIQESLDSFNAYRVQVNQSLIELRDRLNSLELIIQDTNNE